FGGRRGRQGRVVPPSPTPAPAPASLLSPPSGWPPVQGQRPAGLGQRARRPRRVLIGVVLLLLVLVACPGPYLVFLGLNGYLRISGTSNAPAHLGDTFTIEGVECTPVSAFVPDPNFAVQNDVFLVPGQRLVAVHIRLLNRGSDGVVPSFSHFELLNS